LLSSFPSSFLPFFHFFFLTFLSFPSSLLHFLLLRIPRNPLLRNLLI
jgi:hypothetical protein